MVLNGSSTACQIVVDGQIVLEGDLTIPAEAKAIILFAHGSGSGRNSARNQYVAESLNIAGFATLLVDLLTSAEKEIDTANRHLRFNIELLAHRFEEITRWLVQQPQTKNLKIGYFGSSTGAAAAIIAAGKFSDVIGAVVLRSGRSDLAEAYLGDVVAPTLLVVGGSDDAAIVGMNKKALKELNQAQGKELVMIPGAGHMFEEPGKMEEVAKITAEWFESFLPCNKDNEKKFQNRYNNQKSSKILSFLRERHPINIKFKDREAAGEILGALLSRYKHDEHLTVIGIPRGGVVVADAVTRKLAANSLDIVIPRKLRASNNSENAIGAIMHDGSVYVVDWNLIKSMDISNEYIELEKSKQRKEIERRTSLYRSGSREYMIRDRTVILVDDGASTGATITVAARWIKTQNPKKLIIALPVAPPKVKMRLSHEVDDIEVVYTPSRFTSVEQFYQDFKAISDEQVLAILKSQRSLSL